MRDFTKTDCLRLLTDCLVGRLGLVEATGRPYLIPFRFVWFQDAVYLRIPFDGRKHQAIEHCRHVCFEVDEYAADFSHYASATVEGQVVDSLSDEEKKAALVALNCKYERLAGIRHPGPNPVIKGVALRKIAVAKLAGRIFDDTPEPLTPPVMP